MDNARPVIAITMGDPAGIGPETIIKALREKSIYDSCAPLVIGDARIFEKLCCEFDPELRINPVKSVGDALFTYGVIDVYDLENCDPGSFEYGKASPLCAKAAYESICASHHLASTGEADAVATAPINKVAVKLAGIPMIGHTEMYADLTKTDDPLTMFEVLGLRVFFMTRHMSLIDACRAVSEEKVYDFILKCSDAMRSLGHENARLAVAALNPHAGDNGLFGNEEKDFIIPAVNRARLNDRIDVSGPIGADSVFHLGKIGKFDAVLSLYHDQGHIATKTLDFERTISVTVGLPYIRTSVDHGTAFDIAGKGIASGISMCEAIMLAGKYSRSYRK